MARILHIETSTADACSVAVSEDGTVPFSREDFDGFSRAGRLGRFVDEALAWADTREGIDAVAVSCGPGSYTGLRVGAAMAKGLCYGRDLPLIALPTLEVTCVPVLLREELEEDALLCPMVDARRMEVYAAVYDRALHTVRPASADVVDGDTYREWLDCGPVWFMGGGSEKCREVLRHPNARFAGGHPPLARWMAPLAEKAWAAGDFRDVAYFEPFYLKEFVATRPRRPSV